MSRTPRFLMVLAFVMLSAVAKLTAQESGDIGDAFDCSMDCHEGTMIAAIIHEEVVSSDDLWEVYNHCVETRC